jgi:metallo-beta-lactamase family protein
MVSSGDVPSEPVYVDSPLAVNTTDVFRRHPECFDDETRAFVRENRHPALQFQDLKYVRSVDESKSLNIQKDPMIVIAASGMAETGRILHHLKNNIGDPKNTILIVSWQAPDTLGRRLAEGQSPIRIFGEPYDVKAEVVTVGGLSAHAGQDLLVDYAGSIKDRVKKIFLVHGEQKPAEALQESLKAESLPEVYYPALHSAVDL